MPLPDVVGEGLIFYLTGKGGWNRLKEYTFNFFLFRREML